MIKNKKILLLCKETFSYPMYFLGKKLEKNNNDVHYFFVNSSDVIQKSNFNKYTFFYFKERIKKENLHEVKDLYLEIFKNKKGLKIDHKRLKEIEKKYTFFGALNKQILSSQSTSGYYHDRYYYPASTYEENVNWLILNYNKAESVLDLIQPDYIFDLDTAEIQRTIINEIAHSKEIKYVTIEFGRYKNFIVPTFNLGLQLDQYFVNTHKNNKENSRLSKFVEDVKNYRNQDSLTTDVYKILFKNSFKFSFMEMSEYILRKTYRSIISVINYIQRKQNHVKFNSSLYTNSFKKIWWHYLYAIKKFYLLSKYNKYFSSPENEKYVYLPLHVIPESSTSVKAPMYLNEINIIEAVSKSVPIDWKLYIKEHPAMIGQRKLKFYKKISKLQNVKLVKINFYEDSKSWIEKSSAVVTITGSSAFEATMLNKPAFVFGNVCFNVLENIKVIKNLEELETSLKLVDTGNWLKDNTIDCAAYLKTLDDKGVDLNLNYLIELSSKKIHSVPLKKQEEEDFDVLLNCLMNFFEKAVNICKDK
jgi:hypothetical protein